MQGIPVPDLLFDDLPLVAFARPVERPCTKITRDEVRALEGRFGFIVSSEAPLRYTLNSVVYGGWSNTSNTSCALKISANRRRTRSEYERRHHVPTNPCLIESRDIFETDRYAVIEMELCDGDVQGLKLDEMKCWRLLRDVGAALDVIHKSGYIHLDVSPSNILVSGEWFKLGDFGTLLKDGSFTSGCEGAGPYASPETLAFPMKSVSFATDIFSFGVCMLEIASGIFAPRGSDNRYVSLREGHIKLGSCGYGCGYGETLVSLVNAMLDPDQSRRPLACWIVQTATAALTDIHN